MHTRTTAPTALALALAVLAISGCGSSKTQPNTAGTSAARTASSAPAATTTAASASTTTARTPADSTPQFKARIEAICTRRNHVIAGVTTSVANAKELQRVMGARAAVEQKTLNALRKLSVPASLTAPWGQFIAFRGKLIKAELILAREGLRKDQGTELQAVSEAQQELAAVAQREGFNTCTQA